MKLFIIGNGFDIGHNLPTRYWDFRNYLEIHYPDFLYDFEQHYHIYPSMPEERKAELLWNELETNLANIDEDVIIDNGTEIEMDLESGDVGIEDTLYEYFSYEFNYITRLARYLKQWIRSVRIRDTKKKSSLITNENFYINFNYTGVLENVYGISISNIIHIHGSLREYDIDPVLGHGNRDCIDRIHEQREQAESLFDEKWTSICKVIEDYYRTTFKDVHKYSIRLSCNNFKDATEICVIGHSLAGVDKTYFQQIDNMTMNKLKWRVYYYNPDDEIKLRNNLLSFGVNSNAKYKRFNYKVSYGRANFIYLYRRNDLNCQLTPSDIIVLANS